MAGIAIKMGVYGPGNEVNRVLRIFEIVDRSDIPEDARFIFAAYEDDFSDSAIGLLSSMSVIATTPVPTATKRLSPSTYSKHSNVTPKMTVGPPVR